MSKLPLPPRRFAEPVKRFSEGDEVERKELARREVSPRTLGDEAVLEIEGRPSGGRGKGRGGTNDASITIRIPRELIARVDQWAANNEATRSEAIRALIEDGLS